MKHYLFDMSHMWKIMKELSVRWDNNSSSIRETAQRAKNSPSLASIESLESHIWHMCELQLFGTLKNVRTHFDWGQNSFLKVKQLKMIPLKNTIFEFWILLGNHFLLNERKTRIWPGMWVGVVSFSNMLDPNAWSIVCPQDGYTFFRKKRSSISVAAVLHFLIERL